MTPSQGESQEAILDVRRLGVSVGDLALVREVGLVLRRGERVGLIGESGSGKSLTALAVLGLLPEGLRATGSVRLAQVPHDLVGATERQLSRVRGRRVAMVFQEPMTALNPTMRVGDQVAESLLVHRRARRARAGPLPDPLPDRAAARRAAVGLLASVQLPEPSRAARAFPHQLSGGQRQRVVLAIALANDPDVLICDEPTTALDVTVQAQVLDLVVRGVAERSAALLFITHDLAVVATVCSRVLVMYGGRVVEAGPVREVFTRPRHPYTRGLLDASDLDTVEPGARLRTIPGTVPAAERFPTGCVFRTRCPNAGPACAAHPGWTATGTGRPGGHSTPSDLGDGDGAVPGFACHHPVGTGRA